jgi:phage antirepressor YoqD-like protein
MEDLENEYIDLNDPKYDVWYSVGEVARIIHHKGMGRNNLYKFLRSKGLVDKFNSPVPQYVQNGMLKEEEAFYDPDVPGSGGVTRISNKGIEFIKNLLKAEKQNT